MDPLAVVEKKLGRVDSWPSSVIMDMFCEDSKVRISRIAAFMYGNGVRVTMRSCTRRVKQRGGTTLRPICTDGIGNRRSVVLVRYSTTI